MARLIQNYVSISKNEKYQIKYQIDFFLDHNEIGLGMISIFFRANEIPN